MSPSASLHVGLPTPDAEQDLRQETKAILAAARAGSFVPVLGFATSLIDEPGTPQQECRARIAHRFQDLRKYAGEKREEAERAAEGGNVGLDQRRLTVDRKVSELTAAYLDRLSTDFGTATAGAKYDRQSGLVMALQYRIAALTACLTRVWAETLYREPCALSPGAGEDACTFALDNHERAWKSKVHEVLVNAILATEAGDGSDEGMQALKPMAIKAKLYRLLVEVVGVSQEFWRDRSRTAFVSSRLEEIRTMGPLTGVESFLGGVPQLTQPAGRTPSPGIRRDHLVWLSALLRHTLVTGTGAYRTRDEIAFALSLVEPDASVDFKRPPLVRHADLPLEALIAPKDKARAGDIIRSVFQECSANRSPEPFHRSIAGLLYVSHESAQEDGGSRSADDDALDGEDMPNPSLSAGSGWAISTCFDLELERALGLIGPYRVAMPVLVHTGAARLRLWVLGSFPKHRDFGASDASIAPSSGWLPFTEKMLSKTREDGGPVVVKVHGSPLHRVSSLSPEARNEWNLRLEDEVTPDLIFGETDLLQFLDGVLPPLPAAQREIVAPGRKIYFFGLNAGDRSDRIQYYGLSLVKRDPGRGGERGLPQQTGAVFEAFDDSGVYGDFLQYEFGFNRYGEPSLLEHVASELVSALRSSNPGSEMWS